MKKVLFLVLLFLSGVAVSVEAQVTIGENKPAEKFSALEIVSNGSNGLRLPRMTTAERDALADEIKAITDDDKKKLAEGLVIFNTETKCMDFWNGSQWIQMCLGVTSCMTPAITNYSPVTNTVSVLPSVNPAIGITVKTNEQTVKYQWYRNTTKSTAGATAVGKDSASLSGETTLTLGIYYYYCVVTADCEYKPSVTSDYFTVIVANPDVSGKYRLSGKTCFDVNQTTSDGCGSTANRKNDFASGFTFSYEFIHSTNYSNLIFITNDSTIAKVTYVDTIATVTFVDTIVSYAEGRDRTHALNVELIAIYLDNTGILHQITLPISVQDCSCCPGYLAPGGEYATNRTGYLTIGYRTGFNALSGWGFAKTGKDLCFYKRDANNSTKMEQRVARGDSGCKSTNTAHNDGTTGWRLPNIAELGAIQNDYDKLNTKSSSTTDIENLLRDHYWSSTEYDVNQAVLWYFDYSYTDFRMNSYNNYVRCVRNY